MISKLILSLILFKIINAAIVYDPVGQLSSYQRLTSKTYINKSYISVVFLQMILLWNALYVKIV